MVSKLENSNISDLFSGLLASENITIIHDPTIPTAGFDVENRKLILPVWQNVSDQLYCLLIGHEVSHALHTPKDYNKYYNSKNSDLAYCVNLVEDVRVDKLIKSKYPGLKTDYKVGFADLHTRDFFGLSKTQIENHNLFNRLNIYFKLGRNIGLDVPFVEEESLFIDKIDKCITFSDVVTVAKELYEFCKKQFEEEQQQQQQAASDTQSSDNEGSDESEESFSSRKKNDEQDEKNDTENKNESKETSASTDDNKLKNDDDSDDDFDLNDSSETKSSNSDAKTSNNSFIDPITQQTFENNISDKLVTDHADKHNEIKYYDMPSYDRTDIIIDYASLHEKFKPILTPEVLSDLTPKIALFKSKNKKTIDYLIKRFELKKSAMIKANPKITKNGILNPKKLHSYKYSEDLFKKRIDFDRGKNHGIVMLVDCSGSMHTRFDAVIDQMLNLVLFCRKSKIPFEVFGFTSGSFYANPDKKTTNNKSKLGEIIFDSYLIVKNYFSSNMTTTEFNEAISNMVCELLYFAKDPSVNLTGYRQNFYLPNIEYMGGTPLLQSLVLMHQVIDKFKLSNDLDIVNLFVISDGGDTQGLQLQGDSLYNYSSNAFLRDTKHSRIEKMDNNYQVRCILNHIKKSFDCNLVCFYLVSNRSEIPHIVSYYNTINYPETYRQINSESVAKALEQFSAEKFITIDNTGYDEFFVVVGKNTLETKNADDLNELQFGENTRISTIKNKFSSLLQQQQVSRVVLNKLIDVIC